MANVLEGSVGAGGGSVREGLRRGLGSFGTFGDSCARPGVVGCRGGVAGGYKASVSRVVCGAAKMAGRSEPRCAIITGVARAQGIGRHLVYGFMMQVGMLTFLLFSSSEKVYLGASGFHVLSNSVT